MVPRDEGVGTGSARQCHEIVVVGITGDSGPRPGSVGYQLNQAIQLDSRPKTSSTSDRRRGEATSAERPWADATTMRPGVPRGLMTAEIRRLASGTARSATATSAGPAPP